MKSYSYDLHIHSCLSPCSDPHMTPRNIVNRALNKGLDIIALTDHNSTRNVAAAMQAAKGSSLTVIPGVEVTTAEEIDVICLFPDLQRAELAGQELENHLPTVPNCPEYFGQQLVVDGSSAVKEIYQNFLLNALDISIDHLRELIDRFGGICFPAHVDKHEHSILSTLGCLPEALGFTALEVTDPQQFFSREKNGRYIKNHVILTSSGAHRLDDISERSHFVDLEEPGFAGLKKLFRPAAGLAG